MILFRDNLQGKYNSTFHLNKYVAHPLASKDFNEVIGDVAM